MSSKKIARWGRWVRSTAPLFGQLFRRWAVGKLAEHVHDPEAVRHLVGALDVADGRVSARAHEALTKTADVTVAVPLLVTALPSAGARRTIRALVRSLDPSRTLEPLAAAALGATATSAAAKGELRALASATAKNALVDLMLGDQRFSALVGPVIEWGHRHSDEGRHFLLLVLAGRFDEYLSEDFEFQRLRVEYRAAPAGLQQRIREAIRRAGDTRMNALFVVEKRSKLLADLTAEEAELLVAVNARNRNWEELFRYLTTILPARSILTAVRAMHTAGWRPDDADRAALLDHMVALSAEIGEAPAVSRGIAPLNPVLQAWAARGESGELAALPDADLRDRLDASSPPPEQIAALAGLRKRGSLAPADLDRAAQSPHWMVRIVAASFGGPPPAAEPGGSLWIERLALVLDADAVWGGKPFQVTRDGLQALQEGLARLSDRRGAGGLNLIAAVVAHQMAHDIDIHEDSLVGARVVVSEDAIEIEG